MKRGSDYTYSNTRRWLTELKTKNSVGAAAPITVAGTVVLGGVGIYSLMNDITKVATSFADQEFKGGMPILTEQIAKDCGASNRLAELTGDATGLAIDIVGASVKVPDIALQQVFKTENAAKLFKIINSTTNLTTIGSDALPIIKEVYQSISKFNNNT